MGLSSDTKYKNAYNKEKSDRIQVSVKKGEKDFIDQIAKKKGFKNTSEYIKSLIYKDIEKDENSTKNITIGEIHQSGTGNNISL